MEQFFSIDKPTSDRNWFTLLLKYTALFMIIWIAAWFAVFYFITKQQEPLIENAVFDNGGWMSAGIAILVVAFLFYRAWSKFRYGAAFAFRFDEAAQVLTIRSVNTMNDREKETTIPYDHLRITELGREDPLFGRQRIFEIRDKNKLISTVNIELTAWIRHPELELLLACLRKFRVAGSL